MTSAHFQVNADGKHTLICTMFSGQYFSTSASNKRTGLQLCLWREKPDGYTTGDEYTRRNISCNHSPFLKGCFELQP